MRGTGPAAPSVGLTWGTRAHKALCVSVTSSHEQPWDITPDILL